MIQLIGADVSISFHARWARRRCSVNRIRLLALATLALLAVSWTSAHAGVYIGLGFPGPFHRPFRHHHHFGPRLIIAPPPVYIGPTPAPVYLTPVPVYVQPAPTVIQAPVAQPVPSFSPFSPGQSVAPPLAPAPVVRPENASTPSPLPPAPIPVGY
jgi:hypothetical protein